ncbi:hypothetical protein OAF34_04290, partial [Pirellulaceae bacterium]|nr:hypothetical protein [Pirellulaceae bacterium]
LYVNKFDPIVTALKERQGLELKLDAAQKEEHRLREIQSKWPLHESEIIRLENSVKKLKAEDSLLQKELSQAQSYQQSAGKREKLKSAQEAEKKVVEAKTHFATFKGFSAQLFLDLKKAVGDSERHAASMAAGKLQVKFIPESDTKVNIKAGLADSREENVTKALPLHTEAEGVVILTSDQFRLEVESGEGQFSAIQKKYKSAQERLSGFLSTIGVTTIEDANRREAEYSNAKTNLEGEKRARKTILSGQTLAELEKACGNEIPVPKRKAEEINTAILQTGKKINEHQTELEKKEVEIKTWDDEFASQDAVLDRLLDARKQRQESEQNLKKTPPLPPGIENPEALEGEFKEKHGRLTKIKEEELPNAKNEQSILNATEPDHTTQDLKDLITEAESSYLIEKRRLASLIRVKDIFGQMKTQLDSGTFDPWTKRLSTTIQKVTGNRYTDLDFAEKKTTLATGIEIPHELLSMGTKASMGFCIRLSMAAHFLEDLDGFLILDDPMVDLDADRQKKTADLLHKFAEHKQVILLTCHETHAGLLTQSPLRVTRDSGG